MTKEKGFYERLVELYLTAVNSNEYLGLKVFVDGLKQKFLIEKNLL
ncbi:MAG: hypothetical protein FWC11_06250 [Firmicutes bacterium]|nr:hypothetical protein [Bacillota bacterium]